MAFGKADRRRYMAKSFVLLEQPRALEVPPFDTVEEIVEAGIGKGQNCPVRRPQSLGAEGYVPRPRFGRIDQTTPDLGRHLVRGIAPEATELERNIVAHKQLKIIQDLALLRGSVVEFCKITPLSLAPGISRIDGTGRYELSLCIPGKPVRVLRDEFAVLGGVIDDKIHDDAQPMRASGVREPAQ